MRVVVISFDALEYDLVEKFNCNVLKQLEYGKIDLEPYVANRPEGRGSGEPFTPHVYAIFYTGIAPNKEMGYTHSNGFVYDVSREKYKTFFDVAKYPFAQDLPAITGRGPTDKKLPISWLSQTISAPMFSGFFKDIFDISEMENSHFSYMDCKTQIYKVTDKLGCDLIMLYYKEPDHLQHCYAGKAEYKDNYHTLYNKCNSYAKELIDTFDDGETLIIVMSDHGVNQKGGHSHYGFWSSNMPLGKGDSIKITDWFNIITTWYGHGSVPNKNLDSIPIIDEDKKIIAERLRALGYII